MSVHVNKTVTELVLHKIELFSGLNSNKTPGKYIENINYTIFPFKSCKKPSSSNFDLSIPHKSWKKPNQGYIKCNIDASIFKDQNAFGAGVCTRDSQGTFLKARTMWFPGIAEQHEKLRLWLCCMLFSGRVPRS